MTLVWSTKLHLFLYRLQVSLKSNNKNIETPSNDDNNQSEPMKNNIQFEVEAYAHVYLQLSNDCRYI